MRFKHDTPCDSTLSWAARLVKGLKVFEIVLFIICFCINLLPFVWGALTSFKSAKELLAYPPTIAGFDVTFEHYNRVFQDTFFVGVKNSVIYAVFSIVIGVFVGMMAAYAIRRMRFKGKKLIFILILSCIPLSSGSAALVIPNYTFFSTLKMVNTWYILPLIYLGYNLPMAIWVLMSGMESVPIELDEAAKIDGAGRWYILFRIIFPVMLPSIASAALFIFIGAWNEYVASSVLVSRASLYPIQVSIYNYLGYYGVEWGPLVASATAAVIPTLIIFSMLSRMMISGLAAGSVKD